MSRAEIFDRIYRDTAAGMAPREDVTRGYRAYLYSFLRSNRIASLVELGCSDWQISRHMDWTGIDYVGVDISPTALEAAKKFARPGVRFLELDAVTDNLPGADLLVAKDVLQHWSNADILAFLPKLKNYRAALIVNGFPETQAGRLNQDIATGADRRPLDLGQPPFNLKGCFVLAFPAEETKFVFLWVRP